MKIKVAASTFYYPDVTVCCDSRPVDPCLREHPVLIVEVMSPTTGRIDLHEKLIAYKQLESVRECVLISEGQVRVEVHRNIQGDWREESLGNPSDLLALDSVGSSIPLADIYRGVRF